MEKCFVTKLNGTTSNSSLLKLGEMRIIFKNLNSSSKLGEHTIVLSASEGMQLSIVGNGYFCDSSLSQNKGVSVTINVNTNNTLYVNGTEFYVSIPNKYALTYVKVTSKFASFDISALKYSKDLSNLELYNTIVNGDISSLERNINLLNVNMNNTNFSGDIRYLRNLAKLQSLYLSNTEVTGDIANLKSLTALQSLELSNTEVTGDIANLKSLTTLTKLAMSNVSGDIKSFKDMTYLNRLVFFDTFLTGDLAALPANVTFVSIWRNANVFTWGERNASSYILSITGNVQISNIDKMLIDQSKCQVKEGTSEKIISVIGARTSASDAAVATLQSKGYTVSITPA
jgi:hypothetical protein